jgi:formate-dependent nitrite reductase membrane component NrfD
VNVFRRHARWLLLALVFYLSVIVPPVFKLFNKAEPYVLGMPLVLFWIVVVILSMCVALFLMWRRDESEEGR